MAHLAQFDENIIKGFIHCLCSAKFHIIQCLCEMCINRKASFELTNVFLLFNEILVGHDNRIFFAVYSDRNRVASR